MLLDQRHSILAGLLSLWPSVVVGVHSRQLQPCTGRLRIERNGLLQLAFHIRRFAGVAFFRAEQYPYETRLGWDPVAMRVASRPAPDPSSSSGRDATEQRMNFRVIRLSSHHRVGLRLRVVKLVAGSKQICPDQCALLRWSAAKTPVCESWP